MFFFRHLQNNFQCFLGFLFIAFVGPAFSQSQEIDSLLGVVNKLPDGENKASTLLELAYTSENTNDSLAAEFAVQALLLSKKLSFNTGMVDAYKELGHLTFEANRASQALQYLDSALFYNDSISSTNNRGRLLNQKAIVLTNQQKYDEARKFFQQALTLFEQEKDSSQIANVLLNMGVTYSDQGLYSLAQKYYFKCLAIDEKTNYEEGKASDYMSIGIVFKKMGDLESAITYYNKALEINEKLKNDYSIASVLTNLGVAYKDKGELDKALDVQLKAFKMFRDFNESRGQIVALHNIGVVYFKKGDFAKSMQYLKSSLEKAEPLQGSRGVVVNSKLVMARIFVQQNLLDKALTNVKSAFTVATQVGLLEEQHEAARLLSQIYKKKNQPMQALEMSERSILLRDSLFSLEKSRQIRELQTQYETSKKEKEIELLNKEKALWESEIKRKSLQQKMMAVAILLVVVIILILFRLYRSRQVQKRLLLDQQLENEKMEAGRLQELDEAKSRFFANIAHEFRTPLTLILGPSEKIIDESAEFSSRENAGLIRNNASKLLQLTNQLLDLSKLESGMIKLHPEKKDFIAFAKGCIHSFESLASEKVIKINFQSDPEKLDMDFDPEKVSIIINNLLSNALKFTDPAGRIDIEITESNNAVGGEVQIKILDSGIGIPEMRLSHIFDRFYQVDDSSTRKTQGTGIGLALSKELVELHRGKIEVQSILGEGTCFTVVLPKNQRFSVAPKLNNYNSTKASSAAATKGPFESEPETKVASSKALEQTVMVVEDNVEVRKFIIDVLKEKYDVIEAENGKIGLEKVIENVPDLVISDVMMPEMDGYEFCRNVKEDERTSHIPVILLTAKAGMDSKLEGLETGADEYLAKPFNARELMVRIKNLIATRQKLQQKYNESRDESLFPKKENAFITKIKIVIEENIDKEVTMDDLGKALAMSRTQVHRKLKALTSLSTSQFIRKYKLEKALELLRTGEHNVSEVAYKLGFNTPNYFSTCFNEQFGYPPSEVKHQ